METIQNFFADLDIWQILSAFVFMIAIIDPFGNIPITINMEKRGIKISAWRVCLASLIILMAFLFAGEWILKRRSNTRPSTTSLNLTRLAFPMYAGPGAFTALLAITAEYSTSNLCVALILCILVLYLVLIGTHWLTKFMGQTTLYIIRKFFGIIVLAIACKLMFGNLAIVF